MGQTMAVQAKKYAALSFVAWDMQKLNHNNMLMSPASASKLQQMASHILSDDSVDGDVVVST